MKSNLNTNNIGKWCFTLALLFFISVDTFAQVEKYIGFWKPSSQSNKVLQFDTWEEFVEEWKDLGKKEMRLQDFEAVKVGDEFKYTGTWTSGKGKYALYMYDSWKEFTDKWLKMWNDDKELQLIDIEVIPIAGKNFYVGVWGTGKGGTALFQYNNYEDFVAKWKELAKQNQVLIDVEAFNNNGNTNYIGVWETGAGADQRLYITDTFAKFETKWKEFNKEDLRLVDIDISAIKNGELFVGVWNKGTGGQYLWLADSWADFVVKVIELNNKNMNLIDLAMVEYGKPIPPKPPQGKPLPKDTLYFSSNHPLKKDPVSGLSFPDDMPAINYPNFEGCNAADRKITEKAWAVAHHHAWRAYQLFSFLDKSGDSRDNLWSADYTAGNNIELRKKSYSPYAFWGSYDGGKYRYDFIRDAIYMNWNERFQKKMTIKCRRNDSGLHPCYLENPGTNRPPSANHIVNGTINLCNRFFDLEIGETEAQAERDRVRTILHEMFHWLAPKGLAILDTQTHSDMDGWCKTDTDKMYGLDDVMHLATSTGCWGNPKYHRGMAARNNDNYAYFIRNFGEEILNKGMKRFPK